MAENDNTDEDRQENPNDAQACCSTTSGGGDCCSPDSNNSGKSWKMLIFLIIVIAAGVVLARSLINKSNSTCEQTQEGFAAIQPEENLDTPSPPTVTPQVETPVQPRSGTELPSVSSVVNDMTKEDVSVKAAPALWGPDLDSLASLNKVAAETDAVFILL
ncbi:MAG: hypothetical protein ACYTBX_19185, partial [Planctomycetota bacterium]